MSTEPEHNAAHPMFTHRDGTVCIWLEDSSGLAGMWFVPYDAGGEGVECARTHPQEKDADALLQVKMLHFRRGAEVWDGVHYTQAVCDACRVVWPCKTAQAWGE